MKATSTAVACLMLCCFGNTLCLPLAEAIKIPDERQGVARELKRLAGLTNMTSVLDILHGVVADVVTNQHRTNVQGQNQNQEKQRT